MDPLPPIFLVMVVRMLVHMAMLWAKMLSSLFVFLSFLLPSSVDASAFYATYVAIYWCLCGIKCLWLPKLLLSLLPPLLLFLGLNQ